MSKEAKDTECLENNIEDKVDNTLLENALIDKKREESNSALTEEDTTQSSNSDQQKWDDIQYLINTANANVLMGTLAPQVEQNEDLKRKHKGQLLKCVYIFLGIQFGVIFILVMTMLISIIVFHALKNDLPYNIVQMMFAFFGTYITSVIVELICILHYIVENVFDTSISELMEIFGTGSKVSAKQKESKE